jgi:hypothetical protein
MSLELDDISPDGHVPKTVIKDAGSARACYSTFLTDDLPSNLERARIQGVKDRNPPFDENTLRDLGQSGRTNVSWGLAESSIESAATPYYDIITSVPQIATILCNYGGPYQGSRVRAHRERGISPDHDRLGRVPVPHPAASGPAAYFRYRANAVAG